MSAEKKIGYTHQRGYCAGCGKGFVRGWAQCDCPCGTVWKWIKCRHKKDAFTGPRIPAVYGSYLTIICECGAWKIGDGHKTRRWQTTPLQFEFTDDQVS